MVAITEQDAASARVPTLGDKLYKDECMFSFDTALSPYGLFTSLTTFQSFGRDYVVADFERHRHPLYLRQRFRHVRKSVEKAEANGSEPTKVAIGVSGGFSLENEPYEVVKSYSIFCFPAELEISYPSPDVPLHVAHVVEAILARDGVESSDAVAMAWQEEDRKESRYARALVQVPATPEKLKTLSDPSRWVCEDSGMRNNLWLNLSTGHIGSGRKNWDGTGGTGASLKHYEDTGGLYPLALKLGTITPKGADVYSYAPDENDMVTDPLLKQHLAHWGIDMDKQEKTERTMTELEVEMNTKYDFNKITESGSELLPIVGPGYVGLDNLGNSCYMASVIQLLFAIPEIRERYLGRAASIIKSTPAADPSDDVLTMMTKLAVGLLSDRYAKPIPVYEVPMNEGDIPTKISPPHHDDEVCASVRPFMFKRLIGKNHPEFGSARQQDASEFFQYFMEKLAVAEQAGARARLMDEGANAEEFVSTPALFSFEVEERLQCEQSKKYRFLSKMDNMLSLPIPLDKATNTELVQQYMERKNKRQKVNNGVNGDKSAVEEPVKLCVPFEACLNAFAADEGLTDFLSPATQKRGVALKRTRFRTMPQYLVVQLKKYTFDPVTSQAKKLDVVIPMPRELDLESLRSKGPAPADELLPEDAEPPRPQADPAIVAQLMAMGFSENGCKRAALATNNSGAEAGMEWVLGHMGDADFNDPPAAPAGASPPKNDLSEESLANLQAMGFTSKQSRAALIANNNAIDRAADWLFSQADALDNAVDSVLAEHSSNAGGGLGRKILDGIGKYVLMGFASHIGSSTNCGHYVAHIVKDGKFVLFNDAKVAASQNPPTDLGFLYVYKRCS